MTSAKNDLGSSDKQLILQLTRLTQEELVDPTQTDSYLFQRIPKSKKGEIYYLNTVLPAFAEAASTAMDQGNDVLVIDDDGKDVSVGVMVVLSWIFVDDDGKRRSGPPPTGELDFC